MYLSKQMHYHILTNKIKNIFKNHDESLNYLTNGMDFKEINSSPKHVPKSKGK